MVQSDSGDKVLWEKSEHLRGVGPAGGQAGGRCSGGGVMEVGTLTG